MITLTHTVGDLSITYTPPTTARDVLDWTVWISARTGDHQQSFINAAQWAAQWCTEHDEDTLTVALFAEADGEPLKALGHMVSLCNAMAESAGLPKEVLSDLGKLLDRKNEVPPNFRPPGSCGCRQCVAARNGIDMANPPGEPCIFDDIDQRALFASRASDVQNPGAPYYLEQVRQEIDNAQGRKWAFEKHSREERERYHKAMKDRGFMRRDN